MTQSQLNSTLDKRKTYLRTLSFGNSSALNTIVPSKFITKLGTLGLNTSLCNWILDFLKSRSQVVMVGNNTSAMLIHNTGAPLGYVLSLLLYYMFTHDCVTKHDSNTIIKFADNTTVVGLITDDDKTAYREEVRDLSGQQPLPQLQQDKGAYHGPQETKGRACTHPH